VIDRVDSCDRVPIDAVGGLGKCRLAERKGLGVAWGQCVTPVQRQRERVERAHIGNRAGQSGDRIFIDRWNRVQSDDWRDRMRRRFGELLRSEVAETLDEATDIDDEIRALMAIINRSRS